jgi:DNA polymerase-3 subunit alpha
MKVKKIQVVNSKQPAVVVDCVVGKGYLQGPGGQLPDVDIDYQSDRRADIKEYIERRYNIDGRQRVFSAGTFTTLKVKAVLKDVARTKRIPVYLVNYLTTIFDDDKCDFTGIFKLAAENRKMAKFIEDYPDLFEDIRTLMFQPRSASIHASALLVTPLEKDGEAAECFDFVPIKKVDGLLVSENDGYELDELGLLKNDCLATKELSKLQSTMNLCNREYATNLTLESIATSELDNTKAYELLAQGFTQNVFQFASRGMTKFLINMQPTCINDLIAANALYRPATLENGSTESYIDCKSRLVAPTYLWGTYNALKNTYGLITYQEQVVLIAREVGGFSLGDGVKLVKFISKKKTDKIQAMKSKFMEGAKKNACPNEDAVAIWGQIEACGSYLFNKSHATAYAVTSYVGAYLKANYPTAFYTVALQWADDDELVTLMGEMEACSNAKVVPPDINVSEAKFYTDYSSNSIFWSLSRIKQLGTKAVEWILEEREKNGDFSCIVNFIERIFKYKLKKYEYWDDPDDDDEIKRCPVNARHVLNLILAGCFDKIEKAESVIERYAILEKAAERLGFEIKEKDIPTEMRGKHYFWSQQQVKVSGIGAVDYKRIYDNSEVKESIKGRASYTTLQGIAPKEEEGKKVAICATVVEVEEKKFKNKKTGDMETFCKMVLQQNNNTCECIVWPEEYAEHRGKLLNAKDKLIIFSAIVKYSDYTEKNNLQFIRKSIVEVL